MDNKTGEILRGISPFPRRRGFEASEGMSGDLIMILQIMLNELRILHDGYPHIPVSGRYNINTAGAVREFQKIAALPQTGRVNLETWNRMAQEYDMVLNMD